MEEREERKNFVLEIFLVPIARSHAPLSSPLSLPLPPLAEPRPPAHATGSIQTLQPSKGLTKRPGQLPEISLSLFARPSWSSGLSPIVRAQFLLLTARAASADAATASLYDRLGADAIKLVTSKLFDK